MDNKHIKTYSALLQNREMKTEPTMLCHDIQEGLK